METLSWGPPEPAHGSRRRLRAVLPVLAAALAGLAGGYLAGHLSAGRTEPRRSPVVAAIATPGRPDATPLHFVASHWEGRSDRVTKRVTLHVNVTNGGPGPADVLSVGADAPGLALEHTGYLFASGVWRYGPTPPLVLQPGDTIGVILTYRVTNCGSALAAGVRLPVQIRTGAGVRTLHIGSAVPYLGLEEPDVGALVTCR